MREWLKRIKMRFCRHRYLDKNMVSTRYGRNIIFSNACVKCGKVYSIWVSDDDIESWMESDIKKRMML